MTVKDFLGKNKRTVAINSAYGSYRAKCNMVNDMGAEFVICKILFNAEEYAPANDALPSNVIKLVEDNFVL